MSNKVYLINFKCFASNFALPYWRTMPIDYGKSSKTNYVAGKRFTLIIIVWLRDQMFRYARLNIQPSFRCIFHVPIWCGQATIYSIYLRSLVIVLEWSWSILLKLRNKTSVNFSTKYCPVAQEAGLKECHYESQKTQKNNLFGQQMDWPLTSNQLIILFSFRRKFFQSNYQYIL